ncbi:MAG: hypothetical protein K0U60_03270 [Actinomycetia bacterium]|nr:hypothetical protein [Actinomycetes bacterium]
MPSVAAARAGETPTAVNNATAKAATNDKELIFFINIASSLVWPGTVTRINVDEMATERGYDLTLGTCPLRSNLSWQILRWP